MNNTVEKATIKKVTLRIIPFVMVLYFIAFIDRVNLGFAATQMNQELGFSQAAFGLGAGLFFIGYFLFEVPSNLILNKIGARIWIARVMITWGIVSVGMAFIKGTTSFYILRFLLGVSEAGFFPGIIFYLSLWFPKAKRAQATAMFMAAAPISTVVGSPISGALLQMHGIGGLSGWQWLFILEGLPAILLGFVVFFYLTDRPEKAKWLTDSQKQWLITQIRHENEEKQSSSFMKGLTDPKVLALALVYLGTSAGLYTLGIWAPQLIQAQGFSILEVGFLNAIPAVLAVVAMVWWARHSDKTQERPWHVIIACFTAAIGLVLAGHATGGVSIMLALIIVNIGISSSKPPMWSMPTLFLKGSSAAVGIAMINSIGNLGGFLGSFVIGYSLSTTGEFRYGLYLVAALLILSCMIVCVLMLLQKKTPDTKLTSNQLPNNEVLR